MSRLSVRETVLSSLSAIGANREAQFYAELFSQQEPEKFALIVIDPRCLKNPLLETLVSNVKLLFNLGLTPILLVGALDEDRTTVKFQSQRVAKELEQSSVRTSKLNTATYALIPEIKFKAKSGLIPILEMTERRGDMNLVRLVNEINPNKVIFLQPSGGLARQGERIRNLSMADVANLIETGQNLTPGQQRFLSFVQDLDEAEPGQRAYIIASPLNLLPELFTTKGSGTLIKRKAEIIINHNYDGLDTHQLAQSINTAFGKTLRPDFFETPVSAVFVEANYKGGAIFTEQDGLTYLSKFWVGKQAQGEGLARDIWEEFTQNIPVFYWRSRFKNPFNDWYMKNCDGMQKKNDWRVFWNGIEPESVAKAVTTALQAPQDFTE
jgi:acetylglutamate kinase